MTKPTTLNVAELDFNQIKANLKTALQGNPDLADYDYDAAIINTLLDVLSYNTHYNAILANYVANEMSLSTALKRDSVTNHAKNFGYVARSRRSAKAVVNIVITGVEGEPTEYVIPAGSRFETKIKDQSFQFVTTVPHLAYRNSYGEYRFYSVALFEGEYLTYSYPAHSAGSKYVIPNAYIDTDTLTVSVGATTGDLVPENYRFVDNIMDDVGPDSNVYYIQPSFEHKYEIYFGDGKLGKALSLGNQVHVSYVVTSGKTANGAKKFTTSALDGAVTITTTTQSQGGQAEESLSSIKFNASNIFATQNRGVTAGDYAALAKAYSNNIRNVKTWGGEDNPTPAFGTVFLCVIPEFGDFLSEEEKSGIKSYLRSKAVANTKFEFVDPEYLNIGIQSNVNYDLNSLSTTPSGLALLVKDTIQNYNAEQLNNFGRVLRYSELVGLIDNTDISIKNNDTTITLIRKLYPNLLDDADYKVNFATPITSVSSAIFVNNGTRVFFKNDANTLNLYLANGSIFKRNVGTIDFTRGIVYINPISISSYVGLTLNIKAVPAVRDIEGKQGLILQIDPEDVVINTNNDQRA